MANEPILLDRAKQNASTLTKERKRNPIANNLSNGNIVYKRDTGVAYRVGKISLVNGIEHYQLTCAQTNSPYFLSKFALESDYTDDSVKVEEFGLKMVKRLSKMLIK